MGALSVKDRIAAKRGAIAANKSKGVRTYKWKPGKTVFRIIPAKDGGEWDRRFGKTWLKTFDGNQKFSIGDRDITFGENDPVKNMIFEGMRNAPTPEIKDHFKEMLAASKNIFQVLIISVNGAPDPDAAPTSPQIVEVSETQFDNILAQFEAYTDMDPDYDLAGKDGGHLFTCEKSGTGFDTKYTFLATPQKAPLKDEIIESQHDLDAWIQGEFEGLEEKAKEFLQKLGAAAGISISAPQLTGGSNAAQLTADPAAQATAAATAAATATATAQTADSGVSTAAVTTVIDAEFEEAPAEESPFATAPVETPAPTPTPTPAPTPAAEPAAAAAPAAAAPASTSEIDDILAGLQ